MSGLFKRINITISCSFRDSKSQRGLSVVHEAPEGSLVREHRRAATTVEKSGKKLPRCSNESSEDGEVLGDSGRFKWLLRSDCKALILGLGRENLPPLEKVLPLIGSAVLCEAVGAGTVVGGGG